MDKKRTIRKIVYISCFIAFCLIASIAGVNYKLRPAIQKDSFFCDFEYVDGDAVEMTDAILDGNLIVNKDLPMLHYDSAESIDWGILYSDSPNSFQLYLQSLAPIVILSNGYIQTDNKACIELAYHIIKSWDQYRQTDQDNSFIWYDHGTAMRTESLIYFYIVGYRELNILQKNYICNLIRENAEWLYDNDNYYYNHNHGIFEDEALLYAYYFNDSVIDAWKERAEERLQTQIDYAFNKDGVHVENSPAYQMGVMVLLKDISLLLQAQGNPFSENIEGVLRESTHFMTYVTKPNGICASIGDSLTGSATTKKDTSVSLFGDEEYLYSATQGEQGVRPAETKAFFDSGYYIYRKNWDRDDFLNTTWSLFKSGYCSQTHKHADDNSILLYSKGYDLLVDPGYYNYMTGNVYSDYFRSSSAHNTVIVDGKTYSVTSANSTKCGIYDYEEFENYDHIVGFNDEYDGVQWDRHYYNLGDCIIVFDDIVSEESHIYSQLFHLSEHCTLVEYDGSSCLFAIESSGYFVRISQVGAHGINELIKGDEKSTYGHISKELNQIDSIYTLKNDVEGTNVQYVTIITIEDVDGKIEDLESLDYDSGTNRIVFTRSDSKVYIPLASRPRFSSDTVNIKKEGDNTFLFENTAELKGCLYCWYVIDADSAKVEYKSEWGGYEIYI